MEIGVEYGMRLAEYSENLKEGAIHRLANDYPAHSFVIDRAEAEELFHNVRDVESAERDLLCLLGDSIKLPTKDPLVGYLSKEVAETKNEIDHPQEPRIGEAEVETAGRGGAGSVNDDAPEIAAA